MATLKRSILGQALSSVTLPFQLLEGQKQEHLAMTYIACMLHKVAQMSVRKAVAVMSEPRVARLGSGGRGGRGGDSPSLWLNLVYRRCLGHWTGRARWTVHLCGFQRALLFRRLRGRSGQGQLQTNFSITANLAVRVSRRD